MANLPNPPEAADGVLPNNLDPRKYAYQPLSEAARRRQVNAGIMENTYVPRPAKLAWIEKKFVPMSLRDLDDYHPTRLQFLFPHPKEDRSDGWFQNLIHDLFLRVASFSYDYFGRDHIFPWGYREDPWAEKLSPHFIGLASQIARADPRRGSWALLLVSGQERAYLVMGVISKILDASVFSQLLFGVSDEGAAGTSNRATLEAMDKTMLQQEGYYRKAARVAYVRGLLDSTDNTSSKLPPNFWSEVDLLATQTTSLLLPLLNVLRKQDTSREWTSVAQVHQELHNIIAQAAYISVCMAWSKSIFRFTFPETGQLWELEFDNYDDLVYQRSKDRAEAYDRAQIEKERRAAAQRAAEEAAAGAAAGQGQENPPVVQAVNDYLQPPLRAARVKIVLWPLVERFAPLSDAAGYGAIGGDKISRLLPAQVVYYAGREDAAGEMAERYPLLDHVEHLKKERGVRRFWFPRGFVLLLVAFFCLSFHEGIREGTASLTDGTWHSLAEWAKDRTTMESLHWLSF